MMNKKQLTISLAILGVLAIVVICIGLFSGTGSNKEVAYDAELVERIEKLGDRDLSSVTNFKDGVYAVDSDTDGAVNAEITDFEKIGSTLQLNTLNGNIYGVCRVAEDTVYEKATTYKLSCIEVINQTKIKNINDIIKGIKNNTLSRADIVIHEDLYKIKVTNDGTIRINDVLMRKYNLKNRGTDDNSTTQEQINKMQEEYTKEAEKLNEVVLPEVTLSEEPSENTGTEISEEVAENE